MSYARQNMETCQQNFIIKLVKITPMKDYFQDEKLKIDYDLLRCII